MIASAEKSLADRVWFDRRITGRSIGDLKTYLLEDLRMEPDDLQNLKLTDLEIISNSYRSEKIKNLIKAIRQITET